MSDCYINNKNTKPLIKDTSYDRFNVTIEYDKNKLPYTVHYENDEERLPPLFLQERELPSQSHRNKVAHLIENGRWREIYDDYIDTKKAIDSSLKAANYKQRVANGVDKAMYEIEKLIVGYNTEEREQEYVAISTHLGVDVHKEIETMAKYLQTKCKKLCNKDWYSHQTAEEFARYNYEHKKLVVYFQYLEHFVVKHNITEDNCRAPPKDCSICLGKCLHTKLRCGHSFGDECLKKWLKDNRKCPMCRASALPKQCIKI